MGVRSFASHGKYCRISLQLDWFAAIATTIDNQDVKEFLTNSNDWYNIDEGSKFLQKI